MTKSPTFGKLLKDARAKKKWSLMELSMEIYVAEKKIIQSGQLVSWEKGETMPTLKNALIVAKLLNISLDSLR